MKPINRATVNEFHDFNRRCLYDRGFTIQDIDAQALTVNETGGDFRVVALYELKRSYIDVEAWRPFDADRPTYAALLSLARAAGVPLYVVYFVKGVQIEDGTLLHVFRLDAVESAYHGARKVMRALDFARLFPHPIAAAA